MAEYIEREAVLKMQYWEGCGHLRCGVVYAADIENIPAADVVEVVHCRACKYWQDNNGGYPHDECRWGNGETPDADDFCSYGERRETE